MKKADFVVGQLYTFISNAYVYRETVNGYDTFIVPYKVDNEKGAEVDPDLSWNPYRLGITILNRVASENLLSTLVGRVVECICIPKNGGPHRNETQPLFREVDSAGNYTDTFYVISNGRFLRPYACSRPTDENSRQQKASRLEKENEKLAKEIADLELRLEKARETFEKNAFYIDALRNYPTDEEALAALLAEVLSSGGDKEEILKAIKKTAATNLL